MTSPKELIRNTIPKEKASIFKFGSPDVHAKTKILLNTLFNFQRKIQRAARKRRVVLKIFFWQMRYIKDLV